MDSQRSRGRAVTRVCTRRVPRRWRHVVTINGRDVAVVADDYGVARVEEIRASLSGSRPHRGGA